MDDRPDDQDRFVLTRPADVVAVLRELGRRPELLNAYFNQGRESLDTAIVAVDDEAGEVELACGSDMAASRRALQAEGIVVTTRENTATVRFRLERLWVVSRDHGPAFRAAVPQSVYRLQRRAYFRVPVPESSPAVCRLPGGGEQAYTFKATDLSLGGVGIIDATEAVPLRIRDVIEGCVLELPGRESLVMDLEVHNISRHLLRDGSVGRRIGLAFRNLSARGRAVLQGYLQGIQGA
ncbi:flagellar brake protein [Aquisalimonas sp.]|uniref:flagellar brake protein n=1 Tax=Aquisalimonas sp. TaxID=1872621 RepID=UPI0025BBAF95|nr:flagellar brake protein [Aquisalimonas sp.]